MGGRDGRRFCLHIRFVSELRYCVSLLPLCTCSVGGAFVCCVLGLLLDRLACFIIALFVCRILGLLLAIRSCVITVK